MRPVLQPAFLSIFSVRSSTDFLTKVSTLIRFLFFNNQMCKDYYRDWDGLFSRVIPIYSKPEVPLPLNLRDL